MRDSERYTEQAVALGKLAQLAETGEERDDYLSLAGACLRVAVDAADYERDLEPAGAMRRSA